MAQASFRTRFWDTELGNVQTYENLVKKIKEEQKGTKEYLEFLKLRILAEESHGKAVARLAKVSGTKNELGILHGSWQNSHILCADLEVLITRSVQKLMAELDHNQELLNRQMEQRRKEDEEVKDALQSLKNAMSKVQAKQKLQQTKTKELEKARATLQEMQGGTKEAAKAVTALSKTEQQWNASCTAVNQAETQLEDCRISWEFKMDQAFETLQALQEQRLNALTNVQELVLDTFKDQFQLSLSALSRWKNFFEDDVTQEVESFIQRHGNYNEKPAGIPLTDFENDPDNSTQEPVRPDIVSFVSSTTALMDKSASTLQRKFKKMLPSSSAPPKPKPPKPEPRQSSSNNCMIENTMYESLSSVTSTSLKESDDDFDDDDDDDPVYAVVQKVKKQKSFNLKKKSKTENSGYSFNDSRETEEDAADGEVEDESLGFGSYSSGGALMRVLYDYNAKHPTDISLREGELVRFVSTVSDEWVEVRASNGTQGYFPKNYIEPADS